MNQLPEGWIEAYSSNQKRNYYFNKKTNDRFWVSEDLPYGWVELQDSSKKSYYFHIAKGKSSRTYEKPKFVTEHQDTSPTPAPIPLPSYEVSISLPPPSNSLSSSSSSSSQAVANSAQDDESSPRESKGMLSTSSTIKLDSSTSHIPTHDYSTTLANPNPRETTNSSSSSSVFNEKQQHGAKKTDQDLAESFYDNLERKSTKDRGNSLIFHLRCLNNWVKSVLILKFAASGDSVLDLACGKGGDLFKWKNKNISRYTGIDIARKSLEDAVKRIPSRNSFDIRFVHADLGGTDLMHTQLPTWNSTNGWHQDLGLHYDDLFDIVSMQFAFHYLFGESSRAKSVLKTISKVLKPGGRFVLTTVDPHTMIQHLMGTCGSENDQGEPDPISIRDDKNREVCNIQFDSSSRRKLLGHDPDDGNYFGLRYVFTLRDFEEQGEAVDAPEYMVINEALYELLEEFGLKVILQSNFQSFINESFTNSEYKQLAEKMNVLNCEGTISDCEWVIAGLYQVIAIEKMVG